MLSVVVVMASTILRVGGHLHLSMNLLVDLPVVCMYCGDHVLYYCVVSIYLYHLLM